MADNRGHRAGGGKLYLLGGGYDRVTLPKEPPAPHNIHLVDGTYEIFRPT